MNYATDLVCVYCPYCGENIELLVDMSVEHQEYVEDCSVCCRPILIAASVTTSGAEVRVQSENE